MDPRIPTLFATQTDAEKEGIEVLRRLHGQLDQAVQRAEAVFERLQLPDTRSPQRADLIGVFEQTKAMVTALADFLDGLDRELANEGSEASQARLSPDQVRAFLLDVEPPQEGGQGDFHPGVPRGSGAFGKLPSFYGYHVGLDNGLYRRWVPRSFVWRQSMDLWQTLTYFGGTHAAGGLLARLDRISRIQEVRRAPRSSEGGVVGTQTADGQRVLTLGAAPPAQYYPWDRADIAGLRRVAERAEYLATGPDEALLEEARREWCTIMDGWLEAGSSIGSARGIFARLIDEAPAADAAITERLETLAALEYIGEEARGKARAKLR